MTYPASHSVLFVDQTAQLGGAELCLKDIVLARRQPNDHVVLFQDGPLTQLLRNSDVDVCVREASGNSLAIRKTSGLFHKLVSSRDVAHLAREVATAASGVDLIYANTAKALVVSAIAGKLARKPVVYHLHDILTTDHFSRSNRALLVFLARHFVSHTIANSQASCDAFVAAGGRSSNVTVVHNGIDAQPYDDAIESSSRHRSQIRGSLHMDGTPVVALFGRFAPWKGQHVALQAIRNLPDVHLLLVGDALFGEREYVASLHEMASADPLRGRVHFMGFRDDVAALMQASDIVIHCSTAAEPFGRVIVEAMMSDRPVVATRGGGASEIIRDGENGLLVSPGSPKELSCAITRIITGQANVASMVAKAHREARERFALAQRVADVNAVIAAAGEAKRATLSNKRDRELAISSESKISIR